MPGAAGGEGETGGDTLLLQGQDGWGLRSGLSLAAALEAGQLCSTGLSSAHRSRELAQVCRRQAGGRS